MHQIRERPRVADVRGVVRVGFKTALAVETLAIQRLEQLPDDGLSGRIMRYPVVKRLCAQRHILSTDMDN